MNARQLFFELVYRFGHPRWDTGISPPELVERVEGPDALPPGRALDIGCGTGTNTLYLARHGWEAWGVDFATRAIAAARRKALEEDVTATFVRGDVTRLAAAGVAGPFDLLLDLGCFHGVPADRRPAYAAGLAAAARPGADLLLFAFAHPPRRWHGLRAIGASRADVAGHLGGGFELVEVRPGDPQGTGGGYGPAWYHLVRRSG